MEDARETPRLLPCVMACLIGNEIKVNTGVLKGSEAQKRQLHQRGGIASSDPRAIDVGAVHRSVRSPARSGRDPRRRRDPRRDPGAISVRSLVGGVVLLFFFLLNPCAPRSRFSELLRKANSEEF